MFLCRPSFQSHYALVALTIFYPIPLSEIARYTNIYINILIFNNKNIEK
jgi:hypothetical protein